MSADDLAWLGLAAAALGAVTLAAGRRAGRRWLSAAGGLLLVGGALLFGGIRFVQWRLSGLDLWGTWK